MPEIRPTAPNLPRDWRNAWSAFQKLRTVGRTLGEPVDSWTLHYPSRTRKIVDRRWFITYTYRGTTHTAYLGINGTTSVATLNDITKGFVTILEARRAEKKARGTGNSPATQKKDPIYDDNLVSKMWSEWQVRIGKIHSTQELQTFEKQFGYLNWFMKRKAGILDMRMSQYLGTHPHARHGWITPPRTKEEYDRRQRSYEDLIRREESRKRHYD